MRVLVPLDGSDPSWTALEYALEQHPDEDIIVMHVVNPVAGLYSGEGFSDYEQLISAGEERAERLFDEARETATETSVAIDTETRIGNPTEMILECVEDLDIDQIVIGSHGRSGVSRVLLGSVAEAVIRRSSVPVTIVR
ncbi:MAG: universal stress protein [Salinarchaeum sp.]